MDDDLDSLLGGGAPAAPAATASNGSSVAAPAAAAASSAAPMDEDEEESDDDDGGIALVLDAPSGSPRGGGAFGTPIAIKTQRYSKWGTPGQTPGQTPMATPATAAAPAQAQAPVVVTSIQYPPAVAPSSSLSLGVGGGSGAAPFASSGAAAHAARPFRLPLPNDNIFDAGQSIDSRIERPWTLPGADQSDWFNYGFDEETWKLYCSKQIQQRINAKLKGKLTVFDGEEPLPALRGPRMPMGGPAGGVAPMAMPRGPPMPMPMPMAGMPPHALPPHMAALQAHMQQQQHMAMMQAQAQAQAQAQGRAPQMQQTQRIASYDDDASVRLGGVKRER